MVPPGASQSSRFQSKQSSTNYSISQPCYRCVTSRHKLYKCDYFTERIKCNNCNIIEHKASVCSQPRRRKRGKSAFQPWGSAQIQRWKPNSFQPLRVSSGRFTRFLRRGVSGLQQSYSTEELESTSLVLTVYAIQNVPSKQYTVEINNTNQHGSGLLFILFSFQFRLVESSRSTYTTPRSDLKDVSQNVKPVFGIAYVEVKLNGQCKQLRIVLFDRPDTASLLGRE